MATLVHNAPDRRPAASFSLLYVHGWSDYFFNREKAEFFTNIGAEFYAVDMHGVGRSLRPHQIAGYVSDVTDYFPDLDAAASFIRAAHPGLPLVVLAHSQGALSAALWIERSAPSGPSALILNAPWLDLPFTPALRSVLTPIAELWGRYQPQGTIPISSPRLYERTISSEFDGEWPINDAWRVDTHRPSRPGWARAMLHAQQRIAHGLDLSLPILTLTSDASLIRPRWSEEMWHTDVITDVKRTWRQLPRLGNDYTLIKVRRALHDVFLSPEPIRRFAYEQTAAWLQERGIAPRG